jgi:hypothetical protein
MYLGSSWHFALRVAYYLTYRNLEIDNKITKIMQAVETEVIGTIRSMSALATGMITPKPKRSSAL